MKWAEAFEALKNGRKVRGSVVTAPQFLTYVVVTSTFIMHDGRGHVIGRYLLTAEDTAAINWELVE